MTSFNFYDYFNLPPYPTTMFVDLEMEASPWKQYANYNARDIAWNSYFAMHPVLDPDIVAKFQSNVHDTYIKIKLDDLYTRCSLLTIEVYDEIKDELDEIDEYLRSLQWIYYHDSGKTLRVVRYDNTNPSGRYENRSTRRKSSDKDMRELAVPKFWDSPRILEISSKWHDRQSTRA